MSTYKRRKLAKIFGHLTLRYTPTRVYSDYQGHKHTQNYKVVASDSDSVAIITWDSDLEDSTIRHIHFEGDHYWISIGANREWFERVDEQAG